MPIPSGLSAQLGIAEESTYGTPVTVTRFFEMVPGGGPKLEVERVVSAGVRVDRRMHRSSRWQAGKKNVAGEVEMEVANKSFGLWLKHMLGSVATTTPGGGTLSRDHTFTPGALPTGLTVQVGRPDTSGTVRAHTYHGCKVADWELSCAVDELLKLKVNLLGEDEDTATALAVASFPATDALFVFTQGSLTLAGSAFSVKEFSLTGDNGLADDRYFVGSQLRKEPLEAALRDVGGDLAAEFESLTAYNRFVNGTEAALVLLFQGGIIEGALRYEFEITANVRFDGETPDVDEGILQQPLPFKCVASGADSTGLTIRYRTDDTAP